MGYESGLYVRTSLCLGVQADVCEADVCGRVCRRVALPMRNLLRFPKSILIYPRHRVLPVGRLSFGPCIFWCILVTLCALLFIHLLLVVAQLLLEQYQTPLAHS